MMEKTPPEPQRMLSCEEGQVMFHLNVERLDCPSERLCGSMESGLNKPVVFSNGEALWCSLCTCVAIALQLSAFRSTSDFCTLMVRIVHHHSNLKNGSEWDLSDLWGGRCASLFLSFPFPSFLFFFSPQGRIGQWWKDGQRQNWNQLLNLPTPTRNDTCLEAEVNRWCVTDGNLYYQPLEASALKQILRPSRKEEGICIMATGNMRNGIALIGRILIHKQENKNCVFLLLLSLVLPCFFRNNLVYVERFNNSINSANFYGVSSLYFYFISLHSPLPTGIPDSLQSRA